MMRHPASRAGLLLLVLLAAVPGHAAAAPLDLTADDADRVVRDLASLAEAEAAAPSAWPELRLKLEDRVPRGWHAAILHPDVFPAEPKDEERAAVLESASKRAKALAASLREPSRRKPAGEDTRAALERVLARDEFRKAETTAGFWAWVTRQIARAVEWFFGLLERLGTTGYVVSHLILLAAYAGLSTLFVVILLRRLRERRTRAADLPPAESRPLDGAGRTPEECREEGDRMAAAGRWLDALAAWRLWVLLDLDRRSVLAYRPSLYHRDFVTLARAGGAPGPVVQALRSIFADFDRARWGRTALGAASCAGFRETADGIVSYAATASAGSAKETATRE